MGRRARAGGRTRVARGGDGGRLGRPAGAGGPPPAAPPRRGRGAAHGSGVVRRRFDPSGPLRGTVAAPADKSLSHRAALLAAMTVDPVRITGYLDAEDTNSTLAAVQALGALVERQREALVVRGTGLRAAAPGAAIDVGNAG